MVKILRAIPMAILLAGFLATAGGCGKAKEAAMTAVDPVCGMKLEVKEGTLQVQHEGKTYYFCSDHCQGAFQKDPAKYAKAAD